MKLPDKQHREELEIEMFISAYERRYGIKPTIMYPSERPDYVVEDSRINKQFGVELTSVYIDDRSVPDNHNVSGNATPIHHSLSDIHKYQKRIVQSIKTKISKARYYVGFAQINDDSRLLSFFVPYSHLGPSIARPGKRVESKARFS